MKKILLLTLITLTALSCENRSRKEILLDQIMQSNELKEIDSLKTLLNKEIGFSQKWENCTYAGKKYEWHFTPDLFETLSLVDSINTMVFRDNHNTKLNIINQKESSKNKDLIKNLQKKYETIMVKLPSEKRKEVDEYYQVAGNRLIDFHMKCCLK